MSRTDRALQIALALVFAAAGLLKIADPHVFAVSLARIVPMAVVGPLAILLPWVEVVGAAALFLPSFRRSALQLLLGLLAVFTGVLLFGLIRGTSGSCSCFGRFDSVLNRADVGLARNVVLLALCVVLLRKPTSRSGPASTA